MEAFGTRGKASAVIAHHDGTPQGIRRQLHQLFQSSQAPTALLVARSMPALMAASELARWGLRVPQDVAIIARDSDHFHEYFSPQLARYRVDPDVHARRLARILIRLVRGETGRPACVRLMPEFLPGESLGEAQQIAK
jgi:DNA-binding LacI/PurR family transcriptional regulator